jgi:hypothetical protein
MESSGLITSVIFCGVKALLEFKGPTKINHLSEFIVEVYQGPNPIL